jgi:hypothetical protein
MRRDSFRTSAREGQKQATECGQRVLGNTWRLVLVISRQESEVSYDVTMKVVGVDVWRVADGTGKSVMVGSLKAP